MDGNFKKLTTAAVALLLTQAWAVGVPKTAQWSAKGEGVLTRIGHMMANCGPVGLFIAIIGFIMASGTLFLVGDNLYPLVRRSCLAVLAISHLVLASSVVGVKFAALTLVIVIIGRFLVCEYDDRQGWRNYNSRNQSMDK